MSMLKINPNFLKGSWRTKALLVHVLVISPLGFNARVGSFICTWWRHTCYMFPEIHLWCKSTDFLVASMAAELFSSMHLHVPASIYFECLSHGSHFCLYLQVSFLNVGTMVAIFVIFGNDCHQKWLTT